MTDIREPVAFVVCAISTLSREEVEIVRHMTDYTFLHPWKMIVLSKIPSNSVSHLRPSFLFFFMFVYAPYFPYKLFLEETESFGRECESYGWLSKLLMFRFFVTFSQLQRKNIIRYSVANTLVRKSLILNFDKRSNFLSYQRNISCDDN